MVVRNRYGAWCITPIYSVIVSPNASVGMFPKRISPEVGRKSPRMSEANVLFRNHCALKSLIFVFQELLTISHLIPFSLDFHMQKTNVLSINWYHLAEQALLLSHLPFRKLIKTTNGILINRCFLCRGSEQKHQLTEKRLKQRHQSNWYAPP